MWRITLLFSSILSISPLLAQEQTAAKPATETGFFSPTFGILLMFIVFFLFIIWPQQRKAKKHAQFLGGLQKGDEVVTTSGIFGKIVGIADRVITLEIAPQVKIRVDRQTIAAKDSGTQSEAKAS